MASIERVLVISVVITLSTQINTSYSQSDLIIHPAEAIQYIGERVKTAEFLSTRQNLPDRFRKPVDFRTGWKSSLKPETWILSQYFNMSENCFNDTSQLLNDMDKFRVYALRCKLFEANYHC